MWDGQPRGAGLVAGCKPPARPVLSAGAAALGGVCPELSPEVPALALLQGALPACLPREVLDPKSASSELDSGLIWI